MLITPRLRFTVQTLSLFETVNNYTHPKAMNMSSPPTAAVAIIRTCQPEDSFLLLRRTSNPDDPWSGHFSFPGGRREKVDSTLLDTCTRETFEETGICLPEDAIHTTLPPSLAGSRVNSPILVQPYVFHLDNRPEIELEAKEIQSYCWLETKNFRNPQLHVEAEVLPDRFFPAYPLEDYYLWGFTYGLLKHLLRMG